VEEIKQQFIEVIRYSQDIPEPKVGNLFTRWYEAKKNIIENVFGGELIYKTEEKVTFELDQREKSLRFKEKYIKLSTLNIKTSSFAYRL
jgi:hypothetical protein